MAKGGNYERVIAKRLSMWWCGEDDALWRSAGSGGRATSRFKKGKGTSGHESDLCATDKRAIPLLAVFSFEIKCGYSKAKSPAQRADLHDMIDIDGRHEDSLYIHFIKQARAAQTNSGALWWAVIHQRDRRQPLIILPRWALKHLINIETGDTRFAAAPVMLIGLNPKLEVAILPLELFLKHITPDTIKRVHKTRKKT